MYAHVLVLLSDGFHNLGDCLAIGIGLWASHRAKKEKSDEYSYGYARTELLGALVNGCSLLSLAFYVLLEAIPRFIEPDIEPVNMNIGFLFIIGASVGLGLNVLGAIVFFITGKGHSHAGHSHGHDDHGGHEHSHGHGHDEKKKQKKKQKKEKHGHDHDHDHAHKDDDHEHSHKEKEHDHDHDHDHEHDHDHKKKKEKKDKHKHEEDGHEHGHEHEHEHEHEHGHDDDHKKKKKKDKKHKHDHHEESMQDINLVGEAEEKHKDHNLHAIFLHFLGDALSSVFVLATALLWHFFPTAVWIKYVDPAASVIVVIIILWSTIPMVKSVLSVLLQRAPNGIDVPSIAEQLRVPGVISVHDLHIWELISGLNVASVHLDVSTGSDFNRVLKEVKRVFHRNKIHSCTVQPEFVDPRHPGRDRCDENCVSECVAAWCCESNAEPLQDVLTAE